MGSVGRQKTQYGPTPWWKIEEAPNFFLGSPMPIGAYGDDEVLWVRTPDKEAEAASTKVLADAEAMAMALADEELVAVAEAPVAKAILDKEVVKRRLDEAAAESEAKKPRKT